MPKKCFSQNLVGYVRNWGTYGRQTAHAHGTLKKKKKIVLYFSDVLLNRGGKFLKVLVKRVVSAILALKMF